jgi:tetratricopeptide (TPR) repeat protein
MPFKSIKVSHPGTFLFHLHALSIATLTLPVLLRAADAPRVCLTEPRYDSAIVSALDRMYQSEYRPADSLLRGALPPRSAALAYFRGLILFNRFNDLGDTAALSQSAALWEDIVKREGADSGDANLPLYVGLSELQLSYAASLSGHPLRAANLGRKANNKLKPLRGFAEADAALALYDYYKAALMKGVSWLPFVEADVAGPLHRLELAVPQSRYMCKVLQTSLLWLYYDGGRYDEGIALLDAFLARYPGNRLCRQIKADFLFRKKEFAAAGDIQEKLKEEYERLGAGGTAPGCLPIGYLSAIGNLVKVNAALDRPELRKKYLSVWSSSEYRDVMPWLPASLRREVKALAK